jgi:hypothetical protein
MIATSVAYSFSQRFRVPAQAAYEWCTDYEPNDLRLMNENGERSIQRITSDTVILRETIFHNGKKIAKVKLVKLDPITLSWHNVQLSGPNKYSEFLYKISSEGKDKSRLTFIAHLVVYGKRGRNQQRIRAIAKEENRYDSEAWRLLAKAMEDDLHRESA